MIIGRPCVYLCGPIGRFTYEAANGWREEAASMLAPDIRTLNPLRGFPKPEDVGCQVYAGEFYKRTSITPADIVPRDIRDINRADALLRMYPGYASEGSAQENMYAYRVRKIPVVIWRKDNDKLLGPWITSHASKVCETLAESVRYLEHTLL